MADYTLISFSSGLLDNVASHWRGLAGEEAYEVELVQLFDWARDNRDQRAGYAWVRGLQNDATGNVDVILETVPSPQRNTTKLIKVFISPEFWPVDETNIDEINRELVQIHVAAYFAILKEAVMDDMAEVKMYGRTNVSYHLLKTIEETWNSDAIGWTATMQGRWLSMSRSS